MKNLLALFLIFGFISIAALGFLAVNHSYDNGHFGCIVAIFSGIDCLDGTNTFAFLNTHLDFLKAFSVANFNPSVLLSGLIFLGFLFVTFRFSAQGNSAEADFILSRVYLINIESSYRRLKFYRWFRILENSPAYF